jgi:hypothetical protein
MVIDQFEILDLGIVPEGELLTWGASFREFDAIIIGKGNSAKQAFKDALDFLALEGCDTRLLHEAGVEAGFYGEDAAKHLEDIEPMDPDENDSTQTISSPLEVAYMIGIRYNLNNVE